MTQGRALAMSGKLRFSLLLLLTGLPAAAWADELQWRPAGSAATAFNAPAVPRLGGIYLGNPIPLAPGTSATSNGPSSTECQEPAGSPVTTGGYVVRGQAPDG